MGWDERTAVVDTTLGDNKLLLYSMTARETLGRPFLYEMDLLSTDEAIDLSKLLGEPIRVRLQLADFSYREFNGIVTHFSLTGELGRYARYQVLARPWFWLLGQGRNSRIFKNKTVPAIVKEIFREHGFSDFSESLMSESYRTWEYLFQYNESDFNFISRILEQEGIYYFFKHEGGKHTLVLSDSPSSHEKTRGYEEVPYYPPQQKERRERDHIDAWFATRQIRPGTYTARDFNFTAPTKPMHVTLDNFNEHAHSRHEVYDYPGEFVVSSEGEAQTHVRLEELQVDHDTVRGRGNARGLTAGAIFKLDNYPRDDQNKDYLLTDVTYIVRVSGYESGQQEGDPPDYSVTFSAIDAKRQYRPPRVTPKPRVEGPQTAKVVGLKGEESAEISTDNYGRVHILFHWDRLNAAAGEPSCTVRVAQLWAGTGFGGIHIPRIDQEVIVEFLEGDPDRPIVTGRVYNENNMPPYALPDNKTQSGIKSRSVTKGTDSNFNEIRFEDKKGEEELHVQAEKDMSTLIKHDRTTTILRNDTLNITGDQFIKIHGNLSMIVEGVTEKSNPDKSKPVKSSLGVTGAHRIDASDSIDIQAPNRITLTCGDSVINMVPGKITLTTAGSTIAIDANIFSQSNGKAQIMLDANAFVKANGGGSMLLDANVCAQSNGKSQMLLDGDAALTTSGTVSLHGAKLTGKGDTEAGLDGGGSTIALNAASADLAGNQVNVNGKGVVSIGGPMVKIG
ncbi:MAG: type VI secretion system Vgr family protein [Myxococcota bacterium]